MIGKGFDRLLQCISGNQPPFSTQSSFGPPLLSNSDNVVSQNGTPPRVSAPMITVTILRPDNTKTDVLVSLVSDLFNLLGRET